MLGICQSIGKSLQIFAMLIKVKQKDKKKMQNKWSKTKITVLLIIVAGFETIHRTFIHLSISKNIDILIYQSKPKNDQKSMKIIQNKIFFETPNLSYLLQLLHDLDLHNAKLLYTTILDIYRSICKSFGKYWCNKTKQPKK